MSTSDPCRTWPVSTLPMSRGRKRSSRSIIASAASRMARRLSVRASPSCMRAKHLHLVADFGVRRQVGRLGPALAEPLGGLHLGAVVLGLLPLVHQPGSFPSDLLPQLGVLHRTAPLSPGESARWALRERGVASSLGLLLVGRRALGHVQTSLWAGVADAECGRTTSATAAGVLAMLRLESASETPRYSLARRAGLESGLATAHFLLIWSYPCDDCCPCLSPLRFALAAVRFHSAPAAGCREAARAWSSTVRTITSGRRRRRCWSRCSRSPDRFIADVVTAPAAGEDMSGFRPKFADYDVVMSNYNGDRWPKETEAAFVDYLRNGGGFVSVHAANNAFAEWPEYNEAIGLGGWFGRSEKSGPYVYYKDDKLVRDDSPGRCGGHGEQHEFVVAAARRRAPDHARALPERVAAHEGRTVRHPPRPGRRT